MRTFDVTRGETRYQGVVFDDGAMSVRRLSEDPCGRITFTFEGLSECEAELGIDVARVDIEKPGEHWVLHGHPLLRALGRVEALGKRSSASLDHRSLSALATPGRYSADDNGPEPEDVEA